MAIFSAIAVCVTFLLITANELAYQRSKETWAQMAEISRARHTIQLIQRRVADAESAQRGYLLTGDADYLAPYQGAETEIRAAIADLQAYYQQRGVKAHSQTMADLSVSMRIKFAEMQTTILQKKAHNEAAWQGVIVTEVGRRRMVSIRTQLYELFASEGVAIQKKLKSVNDTLFVGRLAIAVLAALILMVLVAYVRKSYALLEGQAATAQALALEREGLEEKIRWRTRQLTRLAEHLQTTIENERQRVARELHDELGALLTAAKFDVARIKSRLPGDLPEIRERLAHLDNSLNTGIALKRQIIEDLRPSSLSNLGLVTALGILLKEFGERSGLSIEQNLQSLQLAPSAELTMFRLVQEALTNIAKHAQASVVSVSLISNGEFAELIVKDNGIGFDPSTEKVLSHGLAGMQFRVLADGGEFIVHSQIGAGTQIQARLPISAPAS